METIKGQCESCGKDYEMKADISKPIICECGEETENWDTVGYSQMAPSIVAITI